MHTGHQPFLDFVIDAALESHADRLHKLWIVFPNRRAGLFFKNQLALRLKQPVWLPNILSSEEFVAEVTGITYFDALESLFAFYDIYKLTEGDKQQSLENFLKWAPTLLRDFNEMDLALAEPRQLLRYLKDQKTIDLWNPESGTLTENQKEYLQFFEKIPEWYTAYVEHMKATKKGSTGFAFRHFSENKLNVLSSIRAEKVILAGFGVLNACEEDIFRFLVNTGKAQCFWDLDRYYTEDEMQEAGNYYRYLKRNQSPLLQPEGIYWSDRLSAGINYEVQAVPVPVSTAENIALTAVLNRIDEHTLNSPDTVVVLCDENLVYPVLAALPVNISHFNLSLGLPFTSTQTHDFISLWMQTAVQVKQYNRLQSGLVITLIQHPFMSVLLSEPLQNSFNDEWQMQQVSGYVKPSFYSHFKDEELKSKLRLLFAPYDDYTTLVDELKQSLENLLVSLQASALQKAELVYGIRLLDMLGKRLPAEAISNPKVIEKLLNTLARNVHIPLSGQPLEGLQLMGLLETRCIAFKNLIFVGFNEANIPGTDIPATFLTHDAKMFHRIPGKSGKDDTISYHFWRLLQHAEKVYFIYNTNEKTGGEPSRYLLQVQKEWCKKNPMVRYSAFKALKFKKSKAESFFSVAKTAEHIELLRKQASKGFSPSALNSFRNCTMQFYLKYVAKVTETRAESDMLGADVFGNILHKLMENAVVPYLKTNLKDAIVSDIIASIDKAADALFEEFVRMPASDSGKYSIDLALIKYYATQYFLFLKKSLVHQPDLVIDSVETELVVQLKPEIAIKGKVDRIDRNGNDYSVLDFKTGSLQQKELTVSDWDDLLSDRGSDKAFQLLTYAWLLHKAMQVSASNIKPAFVNVRQLAEYSKTLNTLTLIKDGVKTHEISDETFQHFESVLHHLTERLFDTSVPFAQTMNTDTCKFCNYKLFCGR